MNELNTGLIIQQVIQKIAEIAEIGGEGVLLENPDTGARFPCVVVSELLFRQKYSGYSYDLSVKVEVWAKGIYEAMLLSDKVRIKLRAIHFRPSSPTPQQYDEITKATRCGGYFECRWNAIENTFEPNR